MWEMTGNGGRYYIGINRYPKIDSFGVTGQLFKLRSTRHLLDLSKEIHHPMGGDS